MVVMVVQGHAGGFLVRQKSWLRRTARRVRSPRSSVEAKISCHQPSGTGQRAKRLAQTAKNKRVQQRRIGAHAKDTTDGVSTLRRRSERLWTGVRAKEILVKGEKKYPLSLGAPTDARHALLGEAAAAFLGMNSQWPRQADFVRIRSCTTVRAMPQTHKRPGPRWNLRRRSWALHHRISRLTRESFCRGARRNTAGNARPHYKLFRGLGGPPFRLLYPCLWSIVPSQRRRPA